MSKRDTDAVPESDCFGEFPHPRETYALFGHRAAEQQLLESYRANRLPQSYIIGGEEGIGKATLAWRFARFLRAFPSPQSADAIAARDLYVDRNHPASHRLEALSDGDVFLLRREWNERSKRHFTEIRVDDVRKMIERFHHASASHGWRIAIIDAAEDLNRSSANAMLKLVEEPPPRSLFLFVANKPARVLPTIRSRSQMLLLSPLQQEEVIEAMSAVDDVRSGYDRESIAAAAVRGKGSVQAALRFLNGGAGVLDAFEAVMAAAPRIDWQKAHDLSDNLAKRENTEDFEAFMGAVFDRLSTIVTHQAPGSPPGSPGLARVAELWEKTAIGMRQVEALNLDRRPFLLTLFNELVQLEQTAAQFSSGE